jgi:dihydrofolate reductase
MGKFRFNISTSLDGFMAGPQQSVENPLGVGGEGLHSWAFELEAFLRAHGMPGGVVNASTPAAEEMQANTGAVIMGRNMFGGHPGPWNAQQPWSGWWGDNPPFHVPVFVLTHHAREPLVMQGGTTFYFVTDGIHAAYERAKQAAGERDIWLGGGAKAAQQYLNAGLLDEINVALVPIFLGSGERLFDQLAPGKLTLERTRVIEAPGVTHLRYRVVK